MHLDPRQRPMTFEQYLAQRGRGASALSDDRCDGCGGGGPLLDGQFCGECLQYQFGNESAEEKLVEAVIGGAVVGRAAGRRAL